MSIFYIQLWKRSEDTGTLASMPPLTATEKVEENDVSETKSKSFETSLLGAPFFAAPMIFGQTFPTVPTFTAIHSVRIRDMETEHKMDREWDPCHSTECLIEKLMLLYKSEDFQLQSPFPTAVRVPCMSTGVGHKWRGKKRGMNHCVSLSFPLIIFC